MRRRPNNQNNGGSYNNQNRRPRYQGGSDRQPHHNSGGGHRPRRNYAQAREKYLLQARDALASGDRVLAENYFQHADHCYRMMVEEGYFTRHQQPSQPADTQSTAVPSEEFIQENTDQLPAFLNAPVEQQKPVDPGTIQNWEERDA
ncbi:MAG: DUF4167 domain-containing protein [Pseudomonadota bacterium]|nr:DUF4167 domain-containing protein [Pseudomonadota bacterium]MDE3038038.1 DUF4167 domain-containing protein [Pseudomonadota bacterium]